MKLKGRYNIIGLEIIGLGGFLLLILLIQLFDSNWNSSLEGFSVVYAIIGATLILVGLETLSVNKRFLHQ